MKRFNVFVLITITLLVFGCNSSEEHKENPKTVGVKKKEVVPKEKGSKIEKSIEDRLKEAEEVHQQTKYYDGLSESFNFRLRIYERGSGLACYDADLKLDIFSKSDSLIQTIRTKAGSCAYGFTDAEVSHVRSLETHFNEKRKLADGYYYGEMVVGDFNFDSLSDIALIYGYPMSGTPRYTFYMQTPKGTFEKNVFYMNRVKHMPVKRNYAKRTFVAEWHTGCCWNYFDYYKVDSLGNCKLTYHRETGPKQE